MERKIEFYKIDYEFLPMASYNKSETELKASLINAITNFIKPDTQHNIKVNEFGNPSVLIEIIEIGNNHLFGIIGKLEDLKGGILKRFRSKEDGTVVDYDKENINFFVENYTYFYVRFTDLICAVLSNYSAPKFKTHFRNYLKDVLSSLFLQSLDIVIVFDNSIDYKINKITHLNRMNLVFDDSSNRGNELLNLTETFHLSQSSLKEASISIDFKTNTIMKETKRMLKKTELLKTDFKKLELIGTDENENNIQMELIERILIKKVFIDIDEKYLKSTNDLEKIKEILVQSISPI